MDVDTSTDVDERWPTSTSVDRQLAGKVQSGRRRPNNFHSFEKKVNINHIKCCCQVNTCHECFTVIVKSLGNDCLYCKRWALFKRKLLDDKTVRLELVNLSPANLQPWLPDPWNRSSLSWAPHPVQRIPKLEPVTGSRKGNKTEKNETDYDQFQGLCLVIRFWWKLSEFR